MCALLCCGLDLGGIRGSGVAVVGLGWGCEGVSAQDCPRVTESLCSNRPSAVSAPCWTSSRPRSTTWCRRPSWSSRTSSASTPTSAWGCSGMWVPRGAPGPTRALPSPLCSWGQNEGATNSWWDEAPRASPQHRWLWVFLSPAPGSVHSGSSRSRGSSGEELPGMCRSLASAETVPGSQSSS